MKYFKHILIILVIATVFVGSCEEFTTQPNLGKQQLSQYFNNPKSAKQFVSDIYRSLGYNSWWKINFFKMLCGMATDNGWAGNIGQPGEAYRKFANFEVDPSSVRITSFWRYTYRGITRANIAIEKIPQLNFDNKQLQKRLVAEAKFLRGYHYLQLAMNFSVPDDRAKDGRGGVPVVSTYSEILEPDIYNYKRSTQDSLYNFIYQNFKEAAAVLPKQSEYPSTQLGRATRGAALAFLGKAYMHQHEFSKAKAAFEKVIESNEYQLDPNFFSIWSVENANNSGTIFDINHAPNPSFRTGGVMGIITQSRNDPDNGWNWFVPTSNLEREYIEEGDMVRLHATIMKHNEPVYGVDGNIILKNFDAALNDNKSGRIWRKYYIPLDKRPRPYGRGQLPKDYILMRYADLLLMHAEAAIETGDEQAALNDLKQVRDRVGLSTDMSLSGTALRDSVWAERRMELAGEFHRLDALRRQKVNGKSRLAQIMGPDGSFVIYNTEVSTDKFETRDIATQVEPQYMGRGFEYPKDLVWPIPAELIQRSGGLIKQNPGY